MLCLMGKALRDNPNKLGAGNAGIAVCGSASSSRRVWRAGGGRISPRVFGIERAAWAKGAPIGLGSRPGEELPGQLLASRRNGGFLRFRGGSTGPVRMTESEWQGQGLGIVVFSSCADQPDRLHRGAPGRAGSAWARVNPPRDRLPSPLPVASGGCQIGEKFPVMARIATIADCSADDVARLKADGSIFGREIPSAPLGSGVRAAHRAGFSEPGQRRPKYSKTEGLGGKSSGSSAKGFSEASKLGPAVRGVN